MQSTETTRSPRTQRQPRRPSRARSTMDTYLDEAGRHSRLTEAEERAQLRRLVELRAVRWQALLSYPSLIDPIVAWLRGPRAIEIEEGMLAPVLDFVRDLDASRSTKSAQALNEAVTGLSMALSVLDIDGLSADTLELLITGRTHLVPEDESGSIAPLAALIDTHRDRTTFASYRRRVVQESERLRHARNRFVCANLRLVVVIAKRYSNRRMSLADRVQEGNLGLLKAVERFDPERGTRFSTYAGWWIRHAITRALINRGRNIRIPAHLHTIFTKTRTAERLLRSELGREPTLEELAAAIDLPPDKVVDACEAMELRGVGLDAPTNGSDTRPVAEVLEAPAAYDADIAMDDRRNFALAHSALGELDPMERDIIEHRFGLHGNEQLTLRTLGERYSLSRERIRQLQNRALRKLRGVVEESPVPAMAFAS